MIYYQKTACRIFGRQFLVEKWRYVGIQMNYSMAEPPVMIQAAMAATVNAPV